MVKCRWAPTLIFPFTGVVVGVGLIILALIFKINAVNWEQEQMVCLDDYRQSILMTINATFLEGNIDDASTIRYVIQGNPVDSPDVVIRAYPDCRFIIRPAYRGRIDNIPLRSSFSTGQNITVRVPRNYTSTFVSGTFPAILDDASVNTSNTGSVGFGISLAIGIVLLVLGLGLFFVFMWVSRDYIVDNCYFQNYDGDEYSNVCGSGGWYNIFNCPCTVNPLLCLRFGMPCFLLWKGILTLIIMLFLLVIGVIALLYTVGDDRPRGRYSY